MTQKLRSDDCEETYDWVTAIIESDYVRLRYHVTDAAVNGTDGINDIVGDWSEDDIRTVVCSTLGILQEDKHLIKLEYA